MATLMGRSESDAVIEVALDRMYREECSFQLFYEGNQGRPIPLIPGKEDKMKVIGMLSKLFVIG